MRVQSVPCVLKTLAWSNIFARLSSLAGRPGGHTPPVYQRPPVMSLFSSALRHSREGKDGTPHDRRRRRARIEPTPSGVVRRRSTARLSAPTRPSSALATGTADADATAATKPVQLTTIQRAQRARMLRGHTPGPTGVPQSLDFTGAALFEQPLLRRLSSVNATPQPAPERGAMDEDHLLAASEPPSAVWAWFTHEGGAGFLDKENQDTCLALQLAPGLVVFAVFDGHGKQSGQLAALAARDALSTYLPLVKDALGRSSDDAAAVLRLAFLTMHDAIRQAMHKADPTTRLIPSERGSAYAIPPPDVVSTPTVPPSSPRPSAGTPPLSPPTLKDATSSQYLSAVSLSNGLGQSHLRGGAGTASSSGASASSQDSASGSTYASASANAAPPSPADLAPILPEPPPPLPTPTPTPTPTPARPERAAASRTDWVAPGADAFVGGEYLLKWMETEEPDPDEPSHKWDAVDGGTTATAVVVRAG